MEIHQQRVQTQRKPFVSSPPQTGRSRGVSPAAGTSQVSHVAGGEADEHKRIAPLSNINLPQKFMGSPFGLHSSAWRLASPRTLGRMPTDRQPRHWAAQFWKSLLSQRKGFLSSGAWTERHCSSSVEDLTQCTRQMEPESTCQVKTRKGEKLSAHGSAS